MPCQPFKLPGGGSGFICTERRRRVPCSASGCTRERVALCDGPGKRPGRTCNARVCELHRLSIGENVDLCPDCGERFAISGAA